MQAGKNRCHDSNHPFSAFIHSRSIAYSPFVRYTVRSQQFRPDRAGFQGWRPDEDALAKVVQKGCNRGWTRQIGAEPQNSRAPPERSQAQRWRLKSACGIRRQQNHGDTTLDWQSVPKRQCGRLRCTASPRNQPFQSVASLLVISPAHFALTLQSCSRRCPTIRACAARFCPGCKKSLAREPYTPPYRGGLRRAHTQPQA